MTLTLGKKTPISIFTNYFLYECQWHIFSIVTLTYVYKIQYAMQICIGLFYFPQSKVFSTCHSEL